MSTRPLTSAGTAAPTCQNGRSWLPSTGMRRGLRSARAEVTTTRDEVAGRQAALEAELAATEQRAASVNRRLYGGEVRASRELQALAADVDALKARASTLEDQVLELMEEREPSEARLADLPANWQPPARRQRRGHRFGTSGGGH